MTKPIPIPNPLRRRNIVEIANQEKGVPSAAKQHANVHGHTRFPRFHLPSPVSVFGMSRHVRVHRVIAIYTVRETPARGIHAAIILFLQCVHGAVSKCVCVYVRMI